MTNRTLEYLKRKAKSTGDPVDIYNYRVVARRSDKPVRSKPEISENAITKEPYTRFALVKLDNLGYYYKNFPEFDRILEYNIIYLLDREYITNIASTTKHWSLIPLYAEVILLFPEGEDEEGKEELQDKWEVDNFLIIQDYYPVQMVKKEAIEWYPIDISEYEHMDLGLIAGAGEADYDEVIDELIEFYRGNHVL